MSTFAAPGFHPRPFRTIAFAGGLFGTTVGAAAAGWGLVEGRALVQSSVGDAPMAPLLALGFLMLGTALAMAVGGRRAPAALLAAIVLTLGLTTLLEGVTAALRLDVLSKRSAGDAHASAMSAQIALCFVGISVAVLGLLREARAPIAATVASLVVAFGAMSMLGYGLDLEPLYGWSGIRRMAWHTALTVTVLSIGLLAAILADSANRAPGLLPEWLYVPAGVFTAAGGLILWHATTSELVSRQVGPLSAGNGATLVVSAAGSVLTASVVRFWVLAQRRKVQLEQMHRDLRQRNEELLRAASEIRTLSGLVPICAWCKSIRDDTGYWKELEHYLSTHADVLFTHGICPSCAAGELAAGPSRGASRHA